MNINDEYQSVRKNVRVYGSVSGNFSFRGENTIWYESTLERDFIKKLEFNDSVSDVVSQPVAIPYVTKNGNQSTYTPDFLVQFCSANCDGFANYPKPILAEIKPRDFLIRDRNKLKVKFKAAWAYASEQGWQFKIYDESRIRDQFLKNIDFISRLGHCPINLLPAHIFKSDHNILMSISLSWHLVARKIFSCDMTQPLNQSTVIWVNECNPNLTKRDSNERS